MTLIIFDLDGVIADTIRLWDAYKPDIFTKIFGFEISAQLNRMNWRGKHLNDIYLHAVTLGHAGSEHDFQSKIQASAVKIYHEAEMVPNLKDFYSWIKSTNCKIALVSSSPQIFVDAINQRLTNMGINLDLSLSVNDHHELKPKPAPDGYLYAIKQLGSSANQTFILEDSLPGLESAIAAGAKTIWFNRYNKSLATIPSEIIASTDSLKHVMDIINKTISSNS